MRRYDTITATPRPGATSLPDFARILIVEDQRFDRVRLQRLISELEFETVVREAEHLADLARLMGEAQFDLVLLDYSLPDGNGLQGLDAIRLDPKNRNAAVIMVTGNEQAEIAIEAMKRGCSDYITKGDLSSSSFRRASIKALQKSRLAIGLETHDTKRQQMEAVLQKFSTECAAEIKPVVSRLMRQLRDLRDAQNLSENQAAKRHARIERSCMRLYEFLDDLEAYRGDDLAQQTYPPDPMAFGPHQATAARKPKPSVFGRLRH